MAQQQFTYHVYDNNDTSSHGTSPTTNNDNKYNNSIVDMSPLSSISSRVPFGLGIFDNNTTCKMNNQNIDNQYDYYCINNVKNNNENRVNRLTMNNYLEDNLDDNVSECNSLGNATFVPAPFLYSNYDDHDRNDDTDNNSNDNNKNHVSNIDAIKNIQNINCNVDVTNNNNVNKEIKTKKNFTMMPFCDLQCTLDEILSMDALLYYTTNIEGSKLIQYLLENEENDNKISNTNYHLFNKQLLSKDKNGNTTGMSICCNVYGNYVIQKYLSVAPFFFADQIVSQLICPNAYQLAFDKHGCRVLQFVISNDNTDDIFTNNKSYNDNSSSNNNDSQNDNDTINEFQTHNFATKKLNIYCYYILYHITLHGHLIECIENVSVNHIVQKCIHHLNNSNGGTKMMKNHMTNDESDDDNTNEDEMSITKLSLKLKFKLFNMMLIQMQHKLYEFSLHKYGCRIIQNFLDFGNLEQKNFIISNLIPYLVPLSCDKYGNYVIQKIVFYNRVLLCNQYSIDNKNNTRNDVMAMLIANFYQLCLNKYGSNVAELCYQYSNDTQKQSIIQQLISCRNNEKDNNNNVDKEKMLAIISLIKHEFGNYVIQKIINLSNEKQKSLLLGIIKKNLSYLKHQIYKHPCIKLFVKNFFPSSK